VASAIAKRAVNTANQATISVSAGVTVSGVSIAVVSNQTWYFRFVVRFTTTATTGLTIGLISPTVNNLTWVTKVPTSGSKNAIVYTFGYATTPAQKVSTVSTALTGTTMWADIEGLINANANGSLKVIIGPTVTGTSLVVMKMSTGMAWRLN